MNHELHRLVSGTGLWLQRGDLDCVDSIQLLDPNGRILPRPPTLEAGGEWESIESPSAAIREVLPPSAPDHRAAAVSDSDVPLRYVPLIVEGLLMQVRQLADGGARTEAVVEILNHVAAMREGRE